MYTGCTSSQLKPVNLRSRHLLTHGPCGTGTYGMVGNWKRWNTRIGKDLKSLKIWHPYIMQITIYRIQVVCNNSAKFYQSSSVLEPKTTIVPVHHLTTAILKSLHVPKSFMKRLSSFSIDGAAFANFLLRKKSQINQVLITTTQDLFSIQYVRCNKFAVRPTQQV